MIDALQTLNFVRPEWLWALLALPALWALWRLRQRRGNVWRNVVDAHLLPHLLEHGGKRARDATWLGALGYLIAVLALAGPSWRQTEHPLWQSQAPLVIALDLSSAITASDLPPSRLLQARAKLATLLRERVGGQVALVVYAGEAFTVAPLTDDTANVALFLDALQPEVMPVDGQNVAQAIETSVRLMQQAGFERGDILVLSDQSSTSGTTAAANALAQGFRVSALGLGTASGAPYRDAGGRIVRARLDAPSLQALTGAGGGTYRSLARDDSDLQALGVLDPEATEASTARGEKGLAWQDEGYWLLPALMLLALFAFRRGGAFAVLMLCVLLPVAMPARAQTQAPERSWWQRPDQQAHARIELGADAYRKGDFAAAEQSFTGIDSATAHYNQGNALAKQDRLDDAIAAYDRALKLEPGMEDAIENRKVVDAARKRQKGSGGDNDNKQQGKDKSAPKTGQQDQSKQDPGQPSQPPPQSRQPPDPQTGKASESPPDAKAQAAADAAQRQRMQQAMAQAGARDDAKAKPDAQGNALAETPEQRERRQAVEAWLRRVPDDPGGLLKTKFRLEHERRQREGQ